MAAHLTSRARSKPQPATRILLVSALAFMAVWRAASAAYFFKQADLWTRPMDLYLNIVATRPYQVQAMNLAARELYTSGDRDTAAKLATDAQALAPWHPSAQMILGSIACDEGRHAEAVDRLNECLARLIQESPLRDYSRLRKGDALMAQRKHSEARAAWLEILGNPNSIQHFDATVRLADLYCRNGNREKAVQTLRKSQSLHPEKSAEIETMLRGILHPGAAPAMSPDAR